MPPVSREALDGEEEEEAGVTVTQQRPRTAVAGRRTTRQEPVVTRSRASGAKMGAGTNSTAVERGAREAEEELARRQVPEEVPTLTELKKALPDHCFRPSLAKSLAYVAKDYSIIAALYLGYVWAESHVPSPVLR